MKTSMVEWKPDVVQTLRRLNGESWGDDSQGTKTEQSSRDGSFGMETRCCPDIPVPQRKDDSCMTEQRLSSLVEMTEALDWKPDAIQTLQSLNGESHKDDSRKQQDGSGKKVHLL